MTMNATYILNDFFLFECTDAETGEFLGLAEDNNEVLKLSIKHGYDKINII